ncbi:MAG TPA: 2'-5' RNA ligase [Treponema sp.]|nr:2'-5' RNA ligase [Treponema sp.]
MDKNLYIVAELDDDTQKLIKGYERIILENGFIGSQTKDIPYHITLCSYSIGLEDYLKNLLEKTGRKFKEFEISYSGFGLFGLNVLYLNPNMNKKLIEVYDFIIEKSFQKGSDLSAHTTLFIDEPENIIKILPKFAEGAKEIKGKIKYISLYEFFPKRFIKRIELEKN